MSNPYRVIKQLALLTGFCIVTGSAVRAQQSYYIYIQSDNGQPFYTQIGEKVYSSSAVGHLIIAGLKDNVCNFEIGFPQHISKPQQFTVPIRGKDHGFQLKKTGTDWALIGWQNQETIKPTRGSGTSAVLYSERKKDDAFATLMAAVVNDSAVLYTSIVKNDAIDGIPAIAKTSEPEKQTVAKTEVKPPMAETGTDSAKEEKKTDLATTAPISQPTDSAKTFKSEKPLYDTSTTVAAAAFKNDKPLYDTAKAVVKPYKSEKPLFDTTAVTVKEFKNDKPLYDTTATAVAFKNDKPLYDTTAAVVVKQPVDETPVRDTATLVKSTAGVSKAEKKGAIPGVVKVQETTNKDGETKLVFIDSSESPANVVTVYISQEQTPVQQKTPAQPVSSEPLATSTPKTETEQKTESAKTPDANKKTDTAVKMETAKTEPVSTKKDTEKAVIKDNEKAIVAPIKQESVQTAKTEPLYRPSEKPAAKKTDTLTIILESPQLKRDTAKTVKQEAPKPLYESKQVTQPVAKQNEGEKNNPTADTDKKVVSQPVIAQKDTAVAKQEAPKALYNPKPASAEPDKKKVVMINSDCARFATDSDVDKLRVKMLAENDIAKKVAIANKVFKTMCLSAKQMKALSELFATDETKYSFLSMAYPFAADTENFKQLYELFTAESYQTRFKTLVRY